MVGPITQSVTDAARMLDVIAGYDPQVRRQQKGSNIFLIATLIVSIRIGILRSVFSSGPEPEPVVEVAEEAVADLKALGAKTIEVDAEIDVDELIDSFHVESFEQQEQFNEYLDSLGSGAPIETFENFVEADEYHESLESGLQAALDIESPTDEPEYFERLYRRDQFIERLCDIVGEDKLDAFFFPHQKQLVVKIGDDQLGRNGFLSSGTGFSSITIPGGFSEEGVPVGMGFLCRPFDEPTLFEVAYAYEQGTQHRQPPEKFSPVAK